MKKKISEIYQDSKNRENIMKSIKGRLGWKLKKVQKEDVYKWICLARNVYKDYLKLEERKLQMKDTLNEFNQLKSFSPTSCICNEVKLKNKTDWNKYRNDPGKYVYAGDSNCDNCDDIVGTCELQVATRLSSVKRRVSHINDLITNYEYHLKNYSKDHVNIDE